MFSLTNPWVVLMLIVALGGAYLKGSHSGFEKCNLENQAQVAKMNEEARAIEGIHQNAVNAIALQLEKANANAKAQDDKLLTVVADSGFRMRVSSTSCVQASADAGTSSGDQSQPTAELDPATGQALFDIAQIGDEAIRSLNACIAAYDQVRNSK
jgi:hypothetical protein